MITVGLLEATDVIQADDLVRQLSLVYAGQEDYLTTTTPFSGARINRLGWIRASEAFPYWVGKTVGEFHQRLFNPKRHATERTEYEFIRGAIPANHLEDHIENRK